MKDTIKNAISALQDIQSNLDKFDGLSASVSELETKHKSLTKDLDETNSTLENKKALLGKAREEAISKHDLEMFGKNESLKDLTAKVAKAKAEFDELRANITSARNEHDDILSSLASLRKRLG